ncbi:MAG TPA: hypothetical protein DCE52_08255, partial [Rhodobacteraceae bacterium]|nr:hypothetical protein [Paracoccaceae bacterium]
MRLFNFSRSPKEHSNFRIAGASERESAYVVEALEPRILLSAAPLDAPVADAPDAVVDSIPQQHVEMAHANPEKTRSEHAP